ncbi:unnamed protein product [Heterosigma akashiwo]
MWTTWTTRQRGAACGSTPPTAPDRDQRRRKTIFWSWAEGSLQGYLPRVSKRDFLQGIGRLTCSCFLPDTMQAITANTDGDVVVWDGSLAATDDGEEHTTSSQCPPLPATTSSPPPRRRRRQPLANVRAIKLVRLSEAPVRCLATVRDRYLCVAGDDGAAPRPHPSAPPTQQQSSWTPPSWWWWASRFYDFQFRLEAWFEDLDAGPVLSVSFSAADPQHGGAPLAANPAFQCPDFVAATSRAYIVGAQVGMQRSSRSGPGRRRGTVLVQGAADQLAGIACHPRLPRLLLCCYSGDVQLWDHQDKTLLMARAFDASKFRPQCAAFHPRGTCLALGFTSGALKLVDPQTLEDCCLFRVSAQPILEVRFSPGGRYMACYDAGFHVALWRYTLDAEAEAALAQEEQYLQDKLGPAARLMRQGWEYIGRHRSHTRAITGLEFGLREDGRRRWRRRGRGPTLVEYDLEGSSSRPASCCWTRRGEGRQVARRPAWRGTRCWARTTRTGWSRPTTQFKLRQTTGPSGACRWARPSAGP